MAETTKKPAAAKKPAAPKAAAAAPKAPVAIKPVVKKTAKPAAKAERTSGLRVTQIGSGDGKGKAQQGTLRGLGLGKMNRSRVLADTPEIRGMAESVPHLVKMEVVG